MISKHIVLLLLLALAIRLALAPISYHPWEYRTFNNVAADLHDGINPYTQFIELSNDAVLIVGCDWYEYWAYPPMALGWLGIVATTDPERVAPFSDIITQTPNMATSLLLKLPIVFADILCGLLLYLIARQRKHQKPESILKYWLFMPFPIFVSAVWGNLDALALLWLLAAVLVMSRNRLAGMFIAVGFAVKIFPAFVGPVFLRHVKSWQWFLLSAASIALITSIYYLVDMPLTYLKVLVGFHGNRPAAGLTMWNIWQLWGSDSIIAYLFNYLWILPLGISWIWIWRQNIEPVRGIALTFMAFCLFSKVVNPVYCLYAMPFLLLLPRVSLAQLLIWQVCIILYSLINVGSPLMYGQALAHLVGIDITVLSSNMLHMLSLGSAWLCWALALNIFIDIARDRKQDTITNLSSNTIPVLN